MPSTTNAATVQPDAACDPHQHARDERAFVEMLAFCAVVWVVWRLVRRWQDRNELSRFRRRPPPGA